jgi:predicted P-loop ATPase
VLIGRQGTYKSTWFYYLLPPQLRQYFFTKTNSQRMSRDDKLTLTQYGLICNEELDTMRLSELNQLKAAVTMPTIDERPAYGHYAEHRKHIASFCGTGNNVEFLSDPTGNRRWLPFEVDSILSPRDHPFDYEAVYAQAYALYRQGFQFWFSQAEMERLGEHNRQFETPRLESELVDVFFRLPQGQEKGEYMPVSRALQIIGGNTVQQLSAVRLGRAFMEQGFRQVRQAHSRGYIVVRRSPEEVQCHLRSLAYEDDKPF